MKSVKEFFGSKKIKVFLIGVFALALKDLLGLNEEAVNNIMSLVVVYIGGQSVIDVALVAKGKK